MMNNIGDPRSTTISPGKAVMLNQDENWKLKDTLTVQLTYFDQKEEYKLLLINGQRTKQSYEAVEGAATYGDFGSILGILFQPSSQAVFHWDRWASLNRQTVMVFDFVVTPTDSQWRIAYENREIVTGFKGSVFIEPAEHRVLRLEANADQIPRKFPIQKSGVELNYRLQTIGEHQFLLPLKAVDWTDTKRVSTKNEVEFRVYRKFTADSKINFDTPPPLPENQIKETTPK